MPRQIANILAVLVFGASVLIFLAALPPPRPGTERTAAVRSPVGMPAPRPVDPVPEPSVATSPGTAQAAPVPEAPPAAPVPAAPPLPSAPEATAEPAASPANATASAAPEPAPAPAPTPSQAAVTPAPDPAPVAHRATPRLLLRLPGTCFAIRQDALDPSCLPRLSAILPELTREPGAVRIEGHSDEVPLSTQSRAYFQDNLGLSLYRAKMVGNFLAQNGVDPARMTVSGFGAARPLVENGTAQEMEANRRVEIWLAPETDR